MRSIERVTFTLTKDQYLEYLTYEASRIKGVRKYKIVTTWSYPAVMIITSIILEKFTYQWIFSVLFTSLAWLYLITILWIKKITPKIAKKLYNQLNIKRYTETMLSFEPDGITIQDNEPVKIFKHHIKHCVFFNDVVIVYYNDKVLIIPQNAFNKKTNVMEFLLALSHENSKF